MRRDSSRGLAVTGGYVSEPLDLVEEAFDEVARLVEVRAEADRVFAVGLWPDGAYPFESNEPRSSS